MIRVISDIHFGDRSCRLRSLGELDPLFEGASEFIVNGDAVDTRPGPYPDRIRELRAELTEFFARKRALLMTGNHDPDISEVHWKSLAGGKVLLVHGDIFFDEITPWGIDAPEICRQIRAGRAEMPAERRGTLEGESDLFREVASRFRQRHHLEPNLWRYAVSFTKDTFWPPTKAFMIYKAWRVAPARAAEFVARAVPQARCVILGHFHRPGVWRMPNGRTVINTGSFCTPFSAWAADVTDDRVVVRKVEKRGERYEAGAVVADVRL